MITFKIILVIVSVFFYICGVIIKISRENFLKKEKGDYIIWIIFTKVEHSNDSKSGPALMLVIGLQFMEELI